MAESQILKIRYRILSHTPCEPFAHSLTGPSPKY
jgi:hypothetical protein